MIGFWADFFTFLQVAISLFLIFIIMLQRGKGGGLVGALGGMGGASAFGPKADIQVLKLTIGLAIAWVVIACAGIFFNRSYARLVYNPVGEKAQTEGADTKEKSKTSTEKGTGKSAAGKAATAKKGDTKDAPATGTAGEKSVGVDETKGETKAAEPAAKAAPAEAAAPVDADKGAAPKKKD